MTKAASGEPTETAECCPQSVIGFPNHRPLRPGDREQAFSLEGDKISFKKIYLLKFFKMPYRLSTLAGLCAPQRILNG